jgi:hypothetical protein
MRVPVLVLLLCLPALADGLVFLGVNDVWHGPKGTSPDDFRAGLKTMVNLAKAAEARVVLATLAVIGESGCGKTVLLKTMIGLVRPLR